MKLERKKLIVIVLAVIIAGALLSRNYPFAGLTISVIVMLFYLRADVITAVRDLIHFRRADGRQRLRAVMWLLMLLITVGALFGKGISYLLLLILLAADYLFTEESSGK